MYMSKTREYTSGKWYKNTLMLIDNNNYDIYFVMILYISVLKLDVSLIPSSGKYQSHAARSAGGKSPLV